MIVVVEIELSDYWDDAVGMCPEGALIALKRCIADGIRHRGAVLSISYKEEKGGESG